MDGRLILFSLTLQEYIFLALLTSDRFHLPLIFLSLLLLREWHNSPTITILCASSVVRWKKERVRGLFNGTIEEKQIKEKGNRSGGERGSSLSIDSSLCLRRIGWIPLSSSESGSNFFNHGRYLQSHLRLVAQKVLVGRFPRTSSIASDVQPPILRPLFLTLRLSRATEMDVTMIGLQNAGKSSLLRVLAVSSSPTIPLTGPTPLLVVLIADKVWFVSEGRGVHG